MEQADSSQDQSGKELIIRKAYQVFREQGYYQTTMADIAQACRMQKGSLYHHFTSKEDLMQQVLLLAHGLFKEEVFAIAYQTRTPPGQRLGHMLEALDRFYFDEQGGCLMGLVGLEVATRQLEFMRTIKQFFTDWIEAFAYLLGAQYSPPEARELAQRSVQEIEGAVMLACIFLDKGYFTATRTRLAQLIK